MNRVFLLISFGICALTMACVDDIPVDHQEDAARGEYAATTCDVMTYERDGHELIKNEFYVFGQINEELAADEGLRDFVGLDRVEDCEQARVFSELNQRYLAQLPDPGDVVIEDGVFPLEPLELADEGIDPSIDPSIEEQKIAYGSISSHAQTVKLFIQEGSGFGNQILCSGTIIGPQAILTAAHCIYSSGRRPITVVAEGSSGEVLVYGNYSTTTNAYGHRHPNYTGTGDAPDDIGVFVLDAPLSSPASSSLSRQRLMVSKTWSNAPITITGYGASTHSGSGVGNQRQGTTTVSWSGSGHFTANGSAGARVCKGDSGGPASRVVSGDYELQVGIASEMAGSISANCPNSDGFNRWTHVGPKISWIESKIGACNRYTSPTNSSITYARCW